MTELEKKLLAENAELKAKIAELEFLLLSPPFRRGAFHYFRVSSLLSAFSTASGFSR